jgi:predicted enzyme related to lactoylglutathione lyase
MINNRVKDLLGLIELLKKEGVTVIGEPQVSEYGKFGWILDPEGNKIELWEPPID